MKTKFSAKQRELILKEAAMPGCSISNIAKRYNMARCTIYAWLRANRAFQVNEAVNTSNQVNDNFVEVALIDPKIVTGKSCSLQKASFIFDDLAFTFEGNLNSKNLQKIINILENIC